MVRFRFFKHCKPAVDDDAFQKMVERQYDVLKKERNKQPDEPKLKVEENGLPPGASVTPSVQENGHPKPEVCADQFYTFQI